MRPQIVSAPSPPRRPVRVLFVNDHLGFPGGVTHGSTTYLSAVLPAFEPDRVAPHLCILRPYHPAADRFADIPLVFLARAKWDPRALTDLVRLIRRWNIDVVHANGMKAHLLGRLAARWTGATAVIHLHMLYRPRPAWLQSWLAGGTARALAVSEPLREMAIDGFRIPPERSETLHNGLDVDRFAPPGPEERRRTRAILGLEPSTPVAGVVGRITREPDKGQRLAIEAMARIHSEGLSDARLLVVGDGPARADCEERAAQLGLGDAVVFLGQRDDVADLYGAMDVAVVPSVVDEALSYAALEAAAAGLPVAAFRGGGLPEVVLDGRTGHLVDTGDVAGLARAIERLLRDPAERRRLGDAGRAHARGFDIGTHVRRLDDMYRQLAG